MSDLKKSKWMLSKDFFISKEGKHIVNFSEDFPMIIRYAHFYIDYKLTQNYHDYLEITYAADGDGVFILGGKKIPIRKGDLFIINNIDLHTILAETNKPLNTASIFFLPELLFQPGDMDFNIEFLNLFYKRKINFIPRISSEKVPKDIPSLITKIYEETSKKNKFYRIKAKTYLQDILVLLANYYKDNITDTDVNYKQDYKNIERLKNVFILLHKESNNGITLEQAAKAACMSPCYFCKFFKKVTGLTFKHYLLNIRIDKAKELILKNNMSITDISFKVGFNNLGYFYREFKKHTNHNPKEYRDLLR